MIWLPFITVTYALVRTPVEEGSARHGDFYLTTHNIHKRQRSRPLAEIEHAVPASEQSQTHALDLVATEFGLI